MAYSALQNRRPPSIRRLEAAVAEGRLVRPLNASAIAHWREARECCRDDPDFDDAERRFHSSLDDFSDQQFASWMADSKLDETNWESLLDAQETVLGIDPDNFEAKWRRAYVQGRIAFGLEQYELAVQHYRSAQHFGGDRALTENGIARAYLRADDHERAETAYLAATEARDWIHPWMNLGALYGPLQGRWEEAVVAYQRAVAIEPENPEARYRLGVALEKAGREAEARQAYSRFLSLDPSASSISGLDPGDLGLRIAQLDATPPARTSRTDTGELPAPADDSRSSYSRRLSPPDSQDRPRLRDRLARPIRTSAGITPPRRLRAPAPKYTDQARRARVQGVVVLEATIDKLGNVTSAKVLKGLPMGLDQAAVEAVRKWKFEPATRSDGTPVAVNYTLTVNFQLH